MGASSKRLDKCCTAFEERVNDDAGEADKRQAMAGHLYSYDGLMEIVSPSSCLQLGFLLTLNRPNPVRFLTPF